MVHTHNPMHHVGPGEQKKKTQLNPMKHLCWPQSNVEHRMLHISIRTHTLHITNTIIAHELHVRWCTHCDPIHHVGPGKTKKKHKWAPMLAAIRRCTSDVAHQHPHIHQT